LIMNTRLDFLPTMRLSRTLFSFMFRLRLLFIFLLAMSLPVAAKPIPSPQPAFLTALISLLNPLSYTWNEVYGVSLSLGVLALFWWVYQLRKKLNLLYDEIEFYRPITNNNSRSIDYESRFLKLEEIAQECRKTTYKIKSDMVYIDEQSRQALALAKTVDTIQKYQTNTRTLEKKEQQTGELNLPTLPYNLHDDLPPLFDGKFHNQPNIDATSVDHAKVVATKYQDAVSRDDRSALRQMVSAEMSITQDCEQALLRGTASASTQLQIDKQGGSYLLICQDNKNWLVPTSLTLKSFTTIQPAKGLFVYERDNVSSAELRRPAEVREDRGVWEVVNMGVVAVPA